MVKECIHHVLVNVLQGKHYDAEEVPEWIEQITNGIKEQLKGHICLIYFYYCFFHYIIFKDFVISKLLDLNLMDCGSSM